MRRAMAWKLYSLTALAVTGMITGSPVHVILLADLQKATRSAECDRRSVEWHLQRSCTRLEDGLAQIRMSYAARHGEESARGVVSNTVKDIRAAAASCKRRWASPKAHAESVGVISR
jgi:hypothetical protein